LKESGLTQTQAAKELGITQARVSDIKRGKIGQFSLDMLVSCPRKFARQRKKVTFSFQFAGFFDC
jgi:predicted XRE-type DNA-binding protein